MALLSHIRETTLGYLGVPYRWGGTTTAGLDCSGLVQLVYSRYLANMPRTTYDQWTLGVAVDRADLEAGELVFFNTDGSGASHVGIYIGDGQFVHSASSARRVVIDRLDAPYYLAHYIGARRVLQGGRVRRPWLFRTAHRIAAAGPADAATRGPAAGRET
jgi:cell wall-associated NlpC family hydrolase